MRLPCTFLTTIILVCSAHAQPGTLDATFGSGGKVALQLGGVATNAFALVVAPDGKVVVAGQTGVPAKPMVMRFLVNGTPDPDFGTGGAIILPLAANVSGEFRAVLLDAQGRILAAGSQGPSGIGGIGERDGLLARFNSNGTLDNTFGTSGTAVVNLSNGVLGDVIRAIALDAQGRIVVCGEANQDPGNSFLADLVVARYTSSGALDNGFGSGGKFIPDLGPAQERGYDVQVRPDNMIVVAGTRTLQPGSENYLTLQVTENGTLATNWGNNGVREVSWGSLSDRLASMALAPDGSVIMGGTAMSAGPQGFGVAKLDPTGNLDQSFGQAGQSYFSPTTTDHYGGFVELQPDGLILLGGSGVFGGSTFDLMLFRRLPQGAPDPSFGTDGLLVIDFQNSSESMGAIALAPDGKVVVAGTANIAGQQHLALARVITGIEVGVPENAPPALRLFPNPVPAGTALRLEGIDDPTVQPTVRDLLGRAIPVPVQRHSTGYLLDVSALAPGRYFVEATQHQVRRVGTFTTY